MEDILDYNPDIIYYKKGEKGWKPAFKKLDSLFIALIFSVFFAITSFINLFGIAAMNIDINEDFGKIFLVIFIVVLGIVVVSIWKTVEVIIRKLWVIYGEESLSVLPNSLSCQRQLAYDFERIIPFEEVQELQWSEYNIQEKWNRHNFPFHFGKLVLVLRNGQKLRMGTDITLEEFQRLDESFSV